MNKLPNTIKDSEDLKEYLTKIEIDDKIKTLILESFHLGYHRALVDENIIESFHLGYHRTLVDENIIEDE